MPNNMPNKLEILPVCPINNHFPFHYYDLYYEYQKEMINEGYLTGDIETEEECVEMAKKLGEGFLNNIIYVDGRKVGIISFQLLGSTNGEPNVLYIDNIYIEKKLRRLGYATVTLLTIEKELKRMNMENTRIWLYVSKKNNIAHQFLDNFIKENRYRYIDDTRCSFESEKDEEKAVQTDDKYLFTKILL